MIFLVLEGDVVLFSKFAQAAVDMLLIAVFRTLSLVKGRRSFSFMGASGMDTSAKAALMRGGRNRTWIIRIQSSQEIRNGMPNGWHSSALLAGTCS
jgi:hypothetical protein